MSKVLKLFNTFTKVIDDVKLGGKLIETKRDAGEIINGSLYICGPTVYSSSHIGHAITYIRADLFRRIMKSVFNMNLTTVMNITDIDDKILAKVKELPEAERKISDTDPTKHPFKRISEKHYLSFMDDMRYIRVEQPDLILKVSQHVGLITSYINQLERKKHVYMTPGGDIYFDTQSMKGYVGRTRNDTDNRINPDPHKRDPRDFVLWKAAKPDEPVWWYRSEITNRSIPGRPGWHVQCSAMASKIFGDQLDFHFGGADLVFPHHYNEEACCCAYHELDTSKSMHVWSKHWLHSGHLVLKQTKMSKSLGNVVAIRSFVTESSVNALRLLCIASHYRSNVDFNTALMDKLRALDHKLSAFVNHLSNGIRRIKNEGLIQDGNRNEDTDVGNSIKLTHEQILDGVCNEFDLEKGLNAILDLSKIVYGKGLDHIPPQDLVSAWKLVNDWCKSCGLEYGPMKEQFNEEIVQVLRDFRMKVRASVLQEMKRPTSREESSENRESLLISLLKNCDDVRAKLDEMGFVERDEKNKID